MIAEPFPSDVFYIHNMSHSTFNYSMYRMWVGPYRMWVWPLCKMPIFLLSAYFFPLSGNSLRYIKCSVHVYVKLKVRFLTTLRAIGCGFVSVDG